MTEKQTLKVDLFGIKEEAEPAEEAAPVSRARPKLWGALLVVDSILVIVFGGALAAKLYQHLYVPVSVVPAAPRRPAPAKPQAAVPAPAPAPAEKPAPPAPAAKPAAPAPAAKPAAPAPAAKPAAPAAAQASPADKRHSVPVEFKLKAPHARSVELAGAFIVRGNGRREMVAQGDGVWALTLYLLPGTSYRYWFFVNGKKRTLDPQNSQVERGASVLVLP
ncbi:MAG: hypothetical protein PHU21_05205 [Elusimicrobia bacterium]|nr:hypothetical protein [Elusimicrobiota bacterium]